MSIKQQSVAKLKFERRILSFLFANVLPDTGQCATLIKTLDFCLISFASSDHFFHDHLIGPCALSSALQPSNSSNLIVFWRFPPAFADQVWGHGTRRMKKKTYFNKWTNKQRAATRTGFRCSLTCEWEDWRCAKRTAQKQHYLDSIHNQLSRSTGRRERSVSLNRFPNWTLCIAKKYLWRLTTLAGALLFSWFKQKAPTP